MKVSKTIVLSPSWESNGSNVCIFRAFFSQTCIIISQFYFHSYILTYDSRLYKIFRNKTTTNLYTFKKYPSLDLFQIFNSLNKIDNIYRKKRLVKLLFTKLNPICNPSVYSEQRNGLFVSYTPKINQHYDFAFYFPIE